MNMKMLLAILTLSGFALLFFTKTKKTNAGPAAAQVSFYDLSVAGIDGDTLHLRDFQGKYVLCVNVASKCGFTPQYKSLQALYEQYQDRLVIIGFPCNQFLMQEPGTEAEIAEFCERNYGVTFPLTEKVKVKGNDQHPVYAWLTDKAQNGVGSDKVGWNFHKFLISPEGTWLASFPSKVDPLSEEIVSFLK